MPALILTLLKLIFVALLFLFVWQISRAITSHISIGVTRTSTKRSKELVLIRSDDRPAETYKVVDVLMLGRSPQADIVVDDPYASEFHMRFVGGDEGLVLHDLGSTNGTYVNGRRVTAPQVLVKGDAVQVGKTVLEVR
ncbi:MAG TPA: FHA domain-containing protein [Acidimicrobiia bacterium]|nr:FHA domain-containing protein [Acidimicrobiia bacterium]